MATTTKGFPYPVGTDRVMDGDDAIKALAEAVDSKIGVLAAGTATIPITTANSTATVTITFSPPLPSAPRAVLMSIGNMVNGPGAISMWTSTTTATSTILAGQRTSTTPFPVQWL